MTCLERRPIDLGVANAADEGHGIVANGEQSKDLATLRLWHYFGRHRAYHWSDYWAQTADNGADIQQRRTRRKVVEQTGNGMRPGADEDDGLKGDSIKLAVGSRRRAALTVSRQPSSLFISGTPNSMAMTKAADLKVLKVL